MKETNDETRDVQKLGMHANEIHPSSWYTHPKPAVNRRVCMRVGEIWNFLSKLKVWNYSTDLSWRHFKSQTGRAYRKTDARAHSGHRLRSILRRRRLPLWRKFNYVFTLNLHRAGRHRMVSVAMGVWGSMYIYICVRAGNQVWSCCGLIYYAFTPPPLGRHVFMYIWETWCVFILAQTRDHHWVGVIPTPEDLAPRRPPGRGGLIATARNAIYT